jgi:branched-subunit amino acid permease
MIGQQAREQVWRDEFAFHLGAVLLPFLLVVLASVCISRCAPLVKP